MAAGEEELIGAGEAGNKIAFIVEALQQSVDKSVKWLLGSWVFYVALIFIFVFLALLSKESDFKGFAAMVAVLNFLGLLGLWISPLRGLRNADIGASEFLNVFYIPISDRIGVLKTDNDAEKLLKERVEHEKEIRAWPNRLLSIGVITVIDLLIWLVWKLPAMALINQVVAMIISQVHISLAPTSAIKAQESLEG